jgi:hypothetical protein
MMAVRIFLGLSAAMWLSYGLYCLAQPGFLGEAAGVSFTTPTGSTELRAMYGGLQAGLGLLLLAGVLRARMAPTALVTLAFLGAGLGVARLLGVFVDGGFSAYTGAALALEFGTVAFCAWLLPRAREAVAV